MKNYIQSSYAYLKSVLFDDLVVRYLLLVSVVLSLTEYYLWEKYLYNTDVYVYLKIGIYPLKLMALLLVINTLLAFFSYNKEKEISYLLLIGNVVIIVLYFSLELFYLNSV